MSKRGYIAILGLRWLLGTALVAGLGLALMVYVLQHTVPIEESQYGKPVAVPASEVVLACPQVPPTLNPQALDDAGNPLPLPQVKGSTTAVVLSRDGKSPAKAVYFPFGVHEEPSATTAEAFTPTNPAPKNKPAELVLHPESTRLFGELPQPVSGFLRADPGENHVALAAANVAQSVSAGDYRGLVAGTCQTPVMDTWLVGGATTPGNSTVLQLLNPSGNSVQVKVEVWADTGKQKFPRGENLKIFPNSQVSIPLESQLPDLQSLALHVTSSGGGVVASLMTHSLQGLTAGGVSLVHAGAPVAQTQVIPGVALNGDSGLVRILNPGMELTHATIEVVGEKGRSLLPSGDNVTLDPQTVTDFTLGGLPAGNYAVVVKAESPVAAGAAVYRLGGESSPDSGRFLRDYAWLPALESGGGVVLAPPGVGRQLLVSNLTESDREINVLGKSQVVNPSTTAVLPLAEGLAALVKAPDLYVTQVLTTDLGNGAGVDSLELTPDLAQTRQIYVHLRS